MQMQICTPAKRQPRRRDAEGEAARYTNLLRSLLMQIRAPAKMAEAIDEEDEDGRPVRKRSLADAGRGSEARSEAARSEGSPEGEQESHGGRARRGGRGGGMPHMLICVGFVLVQMGWVQQGWHVARLSLSCGALRRTRRQHCGSGLPGLESWCRSQVTLLRACTAYVAQPNGHIVWRPQHWVLRSAACCCAQLLRLWS